MSKCNFVWYGIGMLKLIGCLFLGFLIFGGMVAYTMISAIVDPGAAWDAFMDLPGWTKVMCVLCFVGGFVKEEDFEK